jgi:Protein of unknown function (DUF2867)
MRALAQVTMADSQGVNMKRVRLPESAHTSQPWRIHDIAADFRLEDVWALPTPGDSDDFGQLVELMSTLDPALRSSRAVRVLFAIRWKLGELLGLDRDASGLGSRVTTLRDRLPEDLRAAPAGPQAPPFSPLYMTHDEWALEIANRTVHAVLHIGWVPQPRGRYRGQMAVLVRPNGVLGATYMKAITPFRHLIVYPRILREIEREWRAHEATPAAHA